ncbi:outer membrane protein assembly factor BamA [Spirochaetia bacterium]|nr:outer membrane protein assembly factor BamA [Spirochaetia bacterium]
MYLKKLILFLPVFFIFSGAILFAQDEEEWYIGKPIKDIRFDGLNHVSLKELEGITEPFLAQRFTDELFWELQGKLYALELFDEVKPNAVPADTLGSEVIIRFEVVERPVVSKITFRGNKGLRNSELLDVVSLKTNSVANQLKIRLDEQAIIDKYLQKGFPDITVRSEIGNVENSAVEVIFHISEGEKITIEDIRFEGNSIFSERTLRSQISLKPKGIINDGAFMETKLVVDRAVLTQFYHDRGYITMEITDLIREIRKDEKGNHLTLVFRVNEGQLWTFGGVTFEGNHIFSEAQLQALIKSKTGDIVNAGRLEMDLQGVADLYYENGYIFNTIGREEIKDTSENVISYRIPIVERGRAHIERIIVRGNTKTKDHVIRREIPLEPGDVFSKTKIMDGLRNLYNLQYFSEVVPDTPAGSADSLMDLIVNVEEQHTTDIQAGITFSGSSDPDAFPISGLLKWSDRNFLGGGNTLGAELNASPDIQNISLQYTHRWIFGLPLSGGFDFTIQHAKRAAAMDNAAPFFEGNETFAFPDGFWSFAEYDAAGKLPPDAYLMSYEQWSISLGFSTGYRFLIPQGILSLGGGIRVGVKYNDFDNITYRPFDRSLRTRHGEWTPATVFNLSVSLDQRDIYYDPNKGYYFSERFAVYGILPEDVEIEHYNRNDIKAEWFHTLWNWQVHEKWAFKGVFGIHTGLSLIFPQPGYGENPIIEDVNKLSIDGMFIGRGWTGERLNRGLALWENWMELRIPIVPGIIALDWFFDMAVRRPKPGDMFKVFSSEGHNLLEDMRFSFGGGVRFALPQFPFRFLFAKRFHVVGNEFKWVSGSIGGDPNNPALGLDFVISFAVSSY